MGKTIGERVRARREEMGIGRGELAKAAGLAYSTLSDLELGESNASKALHKIAQHLRVNPDWLESGKGTKEASDANAPSQSAGLDVEKMRSAAKFLEDLFAAYGRVFVASEHISLLQAVYVELSSETPPNVVAMTRKYGNQVEHDDERKGQAGSAGADGGGGIGRGARKAAASTRRPR